jgi:hypothetical protein
MVFLWWWIDALKGLATRDYGGYAANDLENL